MFIYNGLDYIDLFLYSFPGVLLVSRLPLSGPHAHSGAVTGVRYILLRPWFRSVEGGCHWLTGASVSACGVVVGLQCSYYCCSFVWGGPNHPFSRVLKLSPFCIDIFMVTRPSNNIMFVDASSNNLSMYFLPSLYRNPYDMYGIPYYSILINSVIM
jgi:hypothetical protein